MRAVLRIEDDNVPDNPVVSSPLAQDPRVPSPDVPFREAVLRTPQGLRAITDMSVMNNGTWKFRKCFDTIVKY